jgi:hypothetical protein
MMKWGIGGDLGAIGAAYSLNFSSIDRSNLNIKAMSQSLVA